MTRQNPGPFARAAALAALVGLLSCAEDGPRLTVNYAPGFVREGVTMSVLGIFRDGRMNVEAWDQLGPRFSATLHKDTCEVAISAGLRAMQPAVFAAVDHHARAEGITDELLDKLAPAANGDSILVITVAGRPPKGKDGGASDSTVTASTPRGLGRAGGRGGGAPPPAGPRDTNVFEVSASLFSKRQHQSVAMVAMTYAGPSEEEAIARFLEKLGASFPGATCAGWNPDLGVDAEAIKRLAEH
jgi:hypothetical protein